MTVHTYIQEFSSLIPKFWLPVLIHHAQLVSVSSAKLYFNQLRSRQWIRVTLLIWKDWICIVRGYLCPFTLSTAGSCLPWFTIYAHCSAERKESTISSGYLHNAGQRTSGFKGLLSLSHPSLKENVRHCSMKESLLSFGSRHWQYLVIMRKESCSFSYVFDTSL